MDIKSFYQNHKRAIWIIIIIVVVFSIISAAILNMDKIFLYIYKIPNLRYSILGVCQLYISNAKNEGLDLYESKIDIPLDDCGIFDNGSEDRYSLVLDVVNREDTRSKIEQIITSYEGVYETTDYTDYSANNTTIAAGIPGKNADAFIKEIRRVIVPQNIVYTDSLTRVNEWMLKDSCNSYLSEIKEYKRKETVDLFFLNNKIYIDEETLTATLNDLASIRDDANYAQTGLNDLTEGISALGVAVQLYEVESAE